MCSVNLTVPLRERAGLEATLAGQSFQQVAAERAATLLEDAA